MRADYLDRCQTAFPGPYPRMTSTLEPSNAQTFWTPIAGRALESGYEFDSDALLHQIADDVGSDEASLPLLQVALAETWKRREGLRLQRLSMIRDT